MTPHPTPPRAHAGKSTLGGQILFLTGGVDKRTIEKYEREAKDKNRESWYMAYIMDTNEEERVKGITVEVGRAKFETEARRYTILDAPGHKNYVPNMIMGAAQVGVGLVGWRAGLPLFRCFMLGQPPASSSRQPSASGGEQGAS